MKTRLACLTGSAGKGMGPRSLDVAGAHAVLSSNLELHTERAPALVKVLNGAFCRDPCRGPSLLK